MILHVDTIVNLQFILTAFTKSSIPPHQNITIHATLSQRTALKIAQQHHTEVASRKGDRKGATKLPHETPDHRLGVIFLTEQILPATTADGTNGSRTIRPEAALLSEGRGGPA